MGKSLNTTVETYNEIIGYHCWKNAPDEVAFLRNPHRHRFEIRCWFEVSDDDREIEIFMQERKIKTFLVGKFGEEMNLGYLSCEMLAKMLINEFKCVSCQVLEDGKGGAYVAVQEYKGSLRWC